MDDVPQLQDGAAVTQTTRGAHEYVGEAYLITKSGVWPNISRGAGNICGKHARSTDPTSRARTSGVQQTIDFSFGLNALQSRETFVSPIFSISSRMNTLASS